MKNTLEKGDTIVRRWDTMQPDTHRRERNTRLREYIPRWMYSTMRIQKDYNFHISTEEISEIWILLDSHINVSIFQM